MIIRNLKLQERGIRKTVLQGLTEQTLMYRVERISGGGENGRDQNIGGQHSREMI